MKTHTRIIHTPLGTMIAVANENAITSLDFTDETISIENADTPLLIQLEEELKNYFEGKLRYYVANSPTKVLFHPK